MDELRSVTLGGAVARLIDHRGRTPTKLGGDFTEDGVPVISARCIKDGIVTNEDRRYVPQLMYERWMPEPLQRGDVLLTSEAPLGEVARWDEAGPVCLGQRLFALRSNPAILDQRFLYYVMCSATVQAQLQSRATGTTAQGIRQSQLREVQLLLPPLPAQRDASDILGALDNKIHANRRTVDLLEEIARTMFQSWFVDFGPVRGTTTLPDVIRRLFPDRLVDSPVGQVPEGWTTAALGEVMSVSRASIDPRDFRDEAFDHYSIPAFDAGRVPAQDQGSHIKSHKLAVPDGCVLLSKLNPRFPRVWWPSSRGDLRRIASTEFIVASPVGGVTRSFLFSLFDSLAFRKRFESLVRGTSGSHQRVSVKDMLEIEVALPPGALIERFDVIVAPMFEQQEVLAAESNTLAELRDALLPRLLSGEPQAVSVA